MILIAQIYKFFINMHADNNFTYKHFYYSIILSMNKYKTKNK